MSHALQFTRVGPEVWGFQFLGSMLKAWDPNESHISAADKTMHGKTIFGHYYSRGPADHMNMMIPEIPRHWALEPGCRIPMPRWPFGLLSSTLETMTVSSGKGSEKVRGGAQ